MVVIPPPPTGPHEGGDLVRGGDLCRLPGKEAGPPPSPHSVLRESSPPLQKGPGAAQRRKGGAPPGLFLSIPATPMDERSLFSVLW